MTTRISSFIAGLLLMVATNVYSMDKNVFSMSRLPRDMQKKVVGEMVTNIINEPSRDFTDFEDAAKEIKNLCLVNKEFKEIINQPEFTLQLIKRFAQRFRMSDEDAANMLGTDGAYERLVLQEELRENMSSINKFAPLCSKQGVDLEFTYDSDRLEMKGRTLLMMAAENYNPAIVAFLCTQEVNVNHIQMSTGFSALGLVIHRIANDRTGEMDRAIQVIRLLLTAGADPEVGVSVSLLEKSPEPIREMMKNAIAKKHAAIIKK